MKKILFICHGNICRSPMAEIIFNDIVRKNKKQKDYYVRSAATSTEELGNPVYPPARKVLAQNGLSCEGKYSVRVTKEDYNNFDMLICMDRNNIRNLKYIIGDDTENKVSLLMDYTNSPGDVADPWYSGNFDLTYNDIKEGCLKLFEYLNK